MNIRKSCFILFLFFYTAAFSQQPVFRLDVDKKPLGEVIQQLEQEHHFLFSYKQTDIEGLQVTLHTETKDIKTLLAQLLNGSSLNFELVGEQYILLKRKVAPTSSLPEEPLLTTYCGFIVDSLTGNPLSFASVYFKNTQSGNYTNEQGRFNFQAPLVKHDTLVISYVGYGEKSIPAAYFTKSPCPRISLNYFDFGEDFIVVTDYLTDGIDVSENGASTVMRPNRIGALPGQVEPDIFSTIQFLPGINSPNGEAASMYVRGGAADQNLILWEGIPIYHPAHFFGMISAFNPYTIDKIKVSRGGFGSDFGGRVSSVIEMESANHNLDKSKYGAGINFLNAYSYGNISLKKNKASIVYSLRRSISEIWRSPTFDNIALRNQQSLLQVGFDIDNIPKNFDIQDEFYFIDGHLKASFNISKQDNISAAVFYNINDFEDKIIDPKKGQNQVDVLDLVSRGASFIWDKKWSDKFSSKFLTSTSNYDYDYTYDITPFPMSTATGKRGQKMNNVTEKQLQLSNRLSIAGQNTLKFGYQLTNFDVDYHIRHEDDKRNKPLANERESFNSNVNVFYAEFISSNRKKLGIDAGLRINHFQLRDDLYLSPRIRLWYKISDALTFQANGGKYYQFISQLVEFRGDNLGFNTPIWVINGNNDAPVLDATQFQAGLLFSKNAWVVDLQAYSKETRGLTSLAIAFASDPQRPESGMSSAKGIDLLVKKRWKDFRTWISYSLGKSDYHFERFFDTDFPAPFDIRHSFKWAGQLSVDQFEFSLGAHICSGTPYSFVKGVEIESGGMDEADNLNPVYDAYNDRYLPYQHHLDASVLYKFASKKNPHKVKGVIGLSVFNIYQHKNIYAREYFIEIPDNIPYRIVTNDKAGLGITPNMVFRLEW